MQCGNGEFGKQLKRYRLKADVTQSRLAARMQLLGCGYGCNNTTISNWERGDRLPSDLGAVVIIAEALLLSEDETRALQDIYLFEKQIEDLEIAQVVRQRLNEMGEHLRLLRAQWRQTNSQGDGITETNEEDKE